MEVTIVSPTGGVLKLRRPHGANVGLKLTMSKVDGEDPVIDMEIGPRDTEYLIKALELFA